MNMNKTGDSILIVDDTLENLRLLSRMLTEHGYRVRAAKSGREALASIQTALPDLVLLDIKLPDLDGYAVCTQLKAHAATRDVPVLFLSALNETKDKLQGFAVGGVDFITKPFQPEEVLARVQTNLKLRRLRTQFEHQADDLRLVNEQLQSEIAERKRTTELVQAANRELELALTREQQLARTDLLTGVNNRLRFFEFAEHTFLVAARYQQPLSIIMLDIDHFKNVNDEFGHLAGDQMLVRVAQVAQAQLRSADIIARYGGEEFVVVLPMTTAPQTMSIAERIRTSVADVRVETEKGVARVTLSLGIAETLHAPKDESVENVLHRADEALYVAKETGRNRVVVHA